MCINITQTLLGGFVASIVWFLVGSILYMNPPVAKAYKKAEVSPAVRKWNSTPKWLAIVYIGVLIQCFLWAFVYAFLLPVLPAGFWIKVMIFGIILTITKIIPRYIDMWTQTTYPNTLLAIEFINGTIGNFVIAIVIAFFIKI
jgi:hypothetical protein